MSKQYLHSYSIPLIGGPLCGDTMKLYGKTLPHTISIVFKHQLYYYSLIINELNQSTEVYYEFHNMENEYEIP